MHAVPKTLTLEEIKEATKADITLQAAIQAIQTKPNSGIMETPTSC
jgi:hypothetical protein